MTRLEECVAVAQCQSVNAQLALLAVKGEHNEYCSRLSIKEQKCGGLDGLLCGLRRRLLRHRSLVD